MVVRKYRVSKTRIRIRASQVSPHDAWYGPLDGTCVRTIHWHPTRLGPYWLGVPCQREPTLFDVHLWAACYANERTIQAREHFGAVAEVRRRLRFKAIVDFGVDLSVMMAVSVIYESVEPIESMTYIEIGPKRKNTVAVPDRMLVGVMRYIAARKQRMVRPIQFQKMMQELRDGNQEVSG